MRLPKVEDILFLCNAALEGLQQGMEHPLCDVTCIFSVTSCSVTRCCGQMTTCGATSHRVLAIDSQWATV